MRTRERVVCSLGEMYGHFPLCYSVLTTYNRNRYVFNANSVPVEVQHSSCDGARGCRIFHGFGTDSLMLLLDFNE